jgi:putative salt-induced outer membrane protein YdiY
MFRKAFSLMLTCVIVLSAVQAALADQVTLKNGDRVSGNIVKSDGKKITVKTEFMGTVEIAWDQVDKLASDKPVYLTLNDNQTVVGLVSTTDADTYEVATKETGNVKVAKASIAMVRNEAEYNSWKAEIERLKNPGLTDLWAGALDVGYAMARGNAETNTFTLSGNAVRATSRDKITAYAAMIRSSGRTARNAADFTQIANAVRGGVRYDLNLTSRTFAFGYADLEFDQFQNLDSRTSLGGGLGYKAIRNETTTFDLFAGGGVTKEYFSAGTPRNRTRAEILLGEELTHKLGARSIFRERFVIFPNLASAKGYRFAFDTSLSTSLTKYIAWQVSFSDRYLSNPPVVTPALKKNDTLLTTGLRFTFAK